MVTYKEFEILNYLTRFQGNTNGAFLAYLEQHLHYPVFDSPKETLTILAQLQKKGYLDDLTVTEFALQELEPYRVKNAILLAAESAIWTARTLYTVPKGLYRKNGETLIERLILQLQEVGIQNIHVVVGSMKEQYFFLEEQYGVTLDVTPRPRKNSVCSLYAVADQLDNTYICPCDTYFPDNPFHPYEYRPFHATVHLDNAAQAMLVRKNDSGRITRIDGGNQGMSGECLSGHAFFDQTFSGRLRRYLENEIDSFGADTLPWQCLVDGHIDNLDLYVRPYDDGAILPFRSIQSLENIDGLFVDNASRKIMEKLCDQLHCQPENVQDLIVLPEGGDDLYFAFTVRGQNYLFCYPSQPSAGGTRKKEYRAQQMAVESGVDALCIYSDEEGCKILRIPSDAHSMDSLFGKDPHFMAELARTIRLFHDAGRNMTDWKDFLTDPIAEADQLLLRAAPTKGDLLRRFRREHTRIVRLFQYTERDGMDKVMCHNSINRNNCLYADDTVNLIHWEHASFGDPAFDFGQILSEYDLDSPAIDEILTAYLGRPATDLERLHWTAYVALHHWCAFCWALYQESVGEDTGKKMLDFYRTAQQALDYALPRYEAYYKVH